MSFVTRRDLMRGLLAALATFGAARALGLDTSPASTVAALVAVFAALASVSGRMDTHEKGGPDAR